MPYQEETIKTIVDRLNTQYFLPSIQREYVWKPGQVVLLFDSIMRGYPISSFLFWELSQDSRDRWEVYKFCEEANSVGTHHIKLPSADGIQSLTLVLDGQQRLTSMLVGLKGIYRIRKPRQWANNPNYFPAYRLYLDLFADPNPVEDDNEFTGKPYYAFKFLQTAPQNDADHWWFRVGRILDCHNEDEFYGLRDTEEELFPEGVTKPKENLYERNLGKLYQTIWKDAAISYYVERDQDYDRVLDIFVRANEAGTELTKPQIILSMLESKWAIGGKKEINGLIDQVNNRLTRRNNINLEVIMRSCLTLTDLPVRYRIHTFTNQNIARIEGLWQDIRDAILRTMTLVNKFGIDQNNLTGLNVLIPLIVYVYQNPRVTFLGTTPFEVKNAGRMRRWLILAMLNRVFARGPEQVLANLRRVIRECPPGADFPTDALNAELSRMRFATDLDEKSIRYYLDSEYPVAFLNLSLLYDDHFWGISTQQDHIFPRALFEQGNPDFATLSPEKQQRFLALVNKAANLELLMDAENNEKRAKPFDQWLATRDASFRQRHLIPEEDELLRFERFDDFIARREVLIAERLKMVV